MRGGCPTPPAPALALAAAAPELEEGDSRDAPALRRLMEGDNAPTPTCGDLLALLALRSKSPWLATGTCAGVLYPPPDPAPPETRGGVDSAPPPAPLLLKLPLLWAREGVDWPAAAARDDDAAATDEVPSPTRARERVRYPAAAGLLPGDA